MIHLDHHHVIGNSHVINEDYSAAGKDPLAYIMVSDGCSSSAHTDVGARLLVLSSQAYLRKHGQREDFSHGTMLRQSLARAHALSRILSLPQASLDASLLLAYVQRQQLHICAHGDGYVFLHHRIFGPLCFEIQYSHNTPYYLSYSLDEGRNRDYQTQSELAVKTLRVNGQGGNSVSLFNPVEWQIPLEQVDSVILATDGLGSLVQGNQQKLLAGHEAMKEMSRFPNLKGRFLLRRLRRALNRWKAQGIINQDDIAIAAMVVDHDNEVVHEDL